MWQKRQARLRKTVHKTFKYAATYYFFTGGSLNNIPVNVIREQAFVADDEVTEVTGYITYLEFDVSQLHKPKRGDRVEIEGFSEFTIDFVIERNADIVKVQVSE